MAMAMAGQAVMAAEAAAAVPDMALTSLVPVEATDSSQQEEKGATTELGMVLMAAGPGAVLATDGAEMAAVPDIMQTSHRKLSEELLWVTASRAREPTVIASQGR
jgi:hypothetical protein